MKFVSHAIWWVTGVYLSVGLHLWLVWLVTQDERWIRSFFDFGGALFFVGMAAVEWYFALVCCRKFSQFAPMRRAWRLISIGSACRLAGLSLAHIYAVPTVWNPYFWIDPAFLSVSADSSRRFGLAVSGPIHMMFLAGGLCQVLIAHRQVGLAERLGWMDRFLILTVGGFTVWQLSELFGSGSQPLTITSALNWLTDPLLSVLLVQSIVLRRTVTRMEGGLICKCWGAFASGVFATSVGSMGIWAASHQYVPWPLSSLTWYVWFLSSAAFALAPAYQLEVMQWNRQRTLSELGKSRAAVSFPV
jgi:hypothetical protein